MHIQKKVLIGCLCLFLLPILSHAEIKTNDKVNLRQGPSTKHEIVTTVKKNTVLADLGATVQESAKTAWYWVDYDGQQCWIMSKFAGKNSINVPATYALDQHAYQDAAPAISALAPLKQRSVADWLDDCAYYNDLLTFTPGDNGRINEILLSLPEGFENGTCDAYSLYEIKLGMMWHEALNTLVHNGFSVYYADSSTLAFNRRTEAQIPLGISDNLVLSLSEEGRIFSVSWSAQWED